MEVPPFAFLAEVRRRRGFGAHRERAREHAHTGVREVHVPVPSRGPGTGHDRRRGAARPRLAAHHAQDDELWRDALCGRRAEKEEEEEERDGQLPAAGTRATHRHTQQIESWNAHSGHHVDGQEEDRDVALERVRDEVRDAAERRQE
ncbi:hypothetical protein GSI_03239 [Ganoderma sinense ZZ0214-1]|uniref:Uncharacterized protein n=1 Tax=Ganoderma sinense ZZ0214-1 TaxID=1077348 RepID=A0A2G8SL42_9APHY|nr:hypothetical protein GSI_03239 [Ganoderma sinense ZZ0214-1]